MPKWFYTSTATFLSFAWVQVVSAQIRIEDTGLHQAGMIYGQEQRNTDIGTYLAKYIAAPLFALSGVIFLVFMLYAGILWMTDQGDADSVGKAKKILVHSTVGLIIMLSAYAITGLVLDALGGGNPTP